MNEKYFLSEYRKLNSQQKQAVDIIEGPVMVIAGPGTGKTQILAMRIANILRKTQVNPSNILALTFTNAAGYEMRKRLLKIIGPASYQVQVHTFHSFCNEVITQFPEKFLFATKINQLSDLEQTNIIRSILDKQNYNLLKPLKSPYHYQKAILANISALKQEGITPDHFISVLADVDNKNDTKDKNNLEKNRELADIYSLYQERLTTLGQYDYNDMIFFVNRKLITDDELLRYYQEKIQYILIDEYQDANSAQSQVAQIIGNFFENPNLFVVGDDEQSIFRFQGANLENILSFKIQYPKAEIIILKQNYRSGQLILDASRELVSHNKKQIFNVLKINKQLLSTNVRKKSVIYFGKFSTGLIENYFVAIKIKKLIKQNMPVDEIAIIYREHSDSDKLCDVLSRFNIPYQKESGLNILDDPELKKLIKIFTIIDVFCKKEAEPILFEVLHYPFFNIRILDLYKLIYFVAKNKEDLFNVLTSKIQIKKAGVTKPQLIINFTDKIFRIANFIKNHSFAEGFEFTLNETGYLEYILNLPDSARHLNNLETLFDDLKLLNAKQKNLTISDYINYLQELGENNLIIKEKLLDYDFKGVKLLTAHQAKGQEFAAVFIIHLVSNKWGGSNRRELIKLPNGFLKNDKGTENTEEEERRLFYVALTRAKKQIYLTFAEDYLDDNLSVTNHQLPSQFIQEIPEKYFTSINSVRYEAQFKKRLKLSFSKKQFIPHKSINNFLAKIIADFSLSPTSFNSYLNCPKEFLYNQILRVPRAKSFDQSYGTAVHKALELFFKKYIRDYKLPSVTTLLTFYNNALNEEILKTDDLRRARNKGSDILTQYFNYYKQKWQNVGPPLSSEYNFYFHRVRFNNIPVTGKIDKIELIDNKAGGIRIIDYKTTSPKSQNFLLGKTRENNTTYLYQAYFYKLLTECDPLFRWQVTEIVFDFISPVNNKFKQVVVPIDENNYYNFKNMIVESYAEILKLNFPENLKVCKSSKCPYASICTVRQ